jgi:hypothetical protein
LLPKRLALDSSARDSLVQSPRYAQRLTALFRPLQVMLHNEDSSMLLMNKDDPHSVYRMDLEYGKVVDEWKVSDHVNVDNILPDSKFAQMTAQQTLIGHCQPFLLFSSPYIFTSR